MALTAERVAVQAGTTVDQVQRCTDHGIIVPDADGGYAEADVQRIRLVGAFVEAGLDEAAIARAIREGHLSLAFADHLTAALSPLQVKTYAEVFAELGFTPEEATMLWAAYGVAAPDPQQGIREDDETLLRLMAGAVQAGIPLPELARVFRVFAESTRRVSESMQQSFRTQVQGQMMESGLSANETLQVSAPVRNQLMQIAFAVLPTMLHRHLELQIFENVSALIEKILEDAGIEYEGGTEPPAVAFVDLTGFTAMTEADGDELAAAHAAALNAVAVEAAAPHGGRVVKPLGDGVMLYFPTTEGAMRASLELAGRLPNDEVPHQVHVGVACGPMIKRDGDYYGRTVNLAARLSAAARAGQVLVAPEIADSHEHLDDLVFAPAGITELKGFDHAIEPCEVRRA